MPFLSILKGKYFQRNSLKFWLADQNGSFFTRRRQWVKLKNGDFFWLYKVRDFGNFKIGKFCNALLIRQEEFKEFKASKFWILILGLKIHERNKVSYLSPQIFGKTDHIILWPFKIFYFSEINGLFPGKSWKFHKVRFIVIKLKVFYDTTVTKKFKDSGNKSVSRAFPKQIFTKIFYAKAFHRSRKKYHNPRIKVIPKYLENPKRWYELEIWLKIFFE